MTDQTVNQDATPIPPEDKPKVDENRTFSQEDVNRIIEGRLAREREKYADYEQFRAAAERLQEIEDAQLSENEKLERQLTEYKTRAEAAEQAIQTSEVRADFADNALKAGIVDVKAAWTLAQADGLHGKYDQESGGVTKHDFEELEKRYPYLFTTTPPGRGSIDGPAGGRATGLNVNQWIRRQAGK